jgi:ubiquinone/menaquinone biosynthesis C-methylase UbiE
MSTDASTATSPRIFPETADIESSSDAYAKRFAGPTGKWMLHVQEQICLEMLKPLGSGQDILDVGGGHGQLALPLARSGHRVTVLGSAPECEHRVKSLTHSKQAKFVVGNVIELPFDDQSFDVAISFRLITHCTQWEALIGELCRVSREAVIIDYPTSQSLNAIAPAFFEAKKRVETNTRSWRLFDHEEVRNAFLRHGFQSFRLQKQFFFPMVIHRMLKLRRVSSFVEAACRLSGLTSLLGSPVIARFNR